jgi:branched-chain amino acid aminotransferase
MTVHKVVITGPQFIGAKRSKAFNKRVGVEIHTDRGKTTARLDDFHDVPLEPNLNPASYVQTFVCGPVIEKAEEVLAEVPEVRERMQPTEAEEIDVANLPFGLNGSDVMFFVQINRGGDWKSAAVKNSLHPFQPFPIDPGAQVLHYAQSGFEGAKAYRTVKGRIVSFRLKENAERHARTAARLTSTPIPTNYYLEAVRSTVLANEHLIAPPGLGAAMYIRPLHFGIGPQLGLAPAPVEAFMIFVSPVGPYFKGGFTPKPMLVQNKYKRSAPGLTGDVKAAGNYANCLLPGLIAKEQDFAEVIYLDAMTGRNVEEVGAANAFFVVDGTLYTPALSGTILAGITRASLITLARDMGIRVKDNDRLPIGYAMRASEAFCSGTAAVVTPIGSVTKGNETVVFNNGKVGPLTHLLYNRLVDIQEERVPDPYRWVYPLT